MGGIFKNFKDFLDYYGIFLIFLPYLVKDKKYCSYFEEREDSLVISCGIDETKNLLTFYFCFGYANLYYPPLFVQKETLLNIGDKEFSAEYKNQLTGGMR